MADLEIQIGARSYRVACEDGQEPHLEAVAARLRQEADALSAQFGTLSETRLLLMSGLIVADRLRAVEGPAGDAGRLSAQLGEAEAREQALAAEKAAMTQELAEATLEIERLRGRADKAAAERDRLREAQGSGSAGGPAPEGDAAARIEALERENARLRDAEAGEASAAAELAALRERVAAAEHRNAVLSDQLSAAETRAGEMAERLEAAEAQAGGDEDSAAETTKALEEATRRIRVLIGDIEEQAAG